MTASAPEQATTADPLFIDPHTIEANLQALHASQPGQAKLLNETAIPPGAVATLGRDGTLTFTWTDNAGKECWLGRTKMPRIRADGLLQAFAVGHGNAALVGIADGWLLHALLGRLAAWQAVFVLDEHPLDCAMAMRLHDYSADLARGRLRLFLGETAWRDLADFFRHNTGYLFPERVLSWPWFGPAAAANIAERLRSTAVASEAAPEPPTAVEGPRDPVRVAIVAPDPSEPAPQLAAALVRAAKALGWTCRDAVADSPARRHPRHAERVLSRVAADRMIAVGATRTMLPRAAAEHPRLILWWPETWPITSQVTAGLAAEDRLIVPYQSMHAAALRCGILPRQVTCVPLAGDAASPLQSSPEFADLDPDRIGLHLDSQKALWSAMVQADSRRERPWSADQAQTLLERAESQTGIRLNNDEVRNGMLIRLQTVLGPGMERNTYVRVWRDSGVESHAALARPFLALPHEGRIDRSMLDAAAAGRPLFVRAHPGQTGPDGWAAFLHPDAHVTVFDSPTGLANELREFISRPAPFIARAADAQAHVAANHTWAHRLQAALDG